MLGRYDQRRRLHRSAVFKRKRDLALGVRFEEIDDLAMTVGGHAFEDAMRIIKRRRPQVGRLVASKAEPDALIASAFVLVAVFIDAHSDMGRLFVQITIELGAVPVKAIDRKRPRLKSSH